MREFWCTTCGHHRDGGHSSGSYQGVNYGCSVGSKSHSPKTTDPRCNCKTDYRNKNGFVLLETKMMTHVHTFKDDKMIGELRGFQDLSLAQIWIDAHRNSRDNDPVWIHFKHGNYEWHVVNFLNEEGDYEIVY